MNETWSQHVTTNQHRVYDRWRHAIQVMFPIAVAWLFDFLVTTATNQGFSNLALTFEWWVIFSSSIPNQQLARTSSHHQHMAWHIARPKNDGNKLYSESIRARCLGKGKQRVWFMKRFIPKGKVLFPAQSGIGGLPFDKLMMFFGKNVDPTQNQQPKSLKKDGNWRDDLSFLLGFSSPVYFHG